MPDNPWKVHERKMAAAFSRWMADLQGSSKKPPQILSRQALHGRMVEKLHGDLAIHPDCPDKWKPHARWFMESFHCDAKKRKNFTLTSILRSPDHAFWEWWDKITDEAGPKGRLMLATSQNCLVLIYGSKERTWFSDVMGYGPFTEYKVEAKDREYVYFCHLESLLHWADPLCLGGPDPL